MPKKKLPAVDGLGPKDIKRIRQAVRDVWRYGHAHKLVVKRCLLKSGFSKCEGCRKKVPRIYVDHIVKVGDVDEGFIKRMFVPSNRMQGLCAKCHDLKTRGERMKDFY